MFPFTDTKGFTDNLSKFIDDMKLVQRDFDRLENRNLMKFNKNKHKILHLRRNSPTWNMMVTTS